MTYDKGPLPLDKTGTNPDNLVLGEPHTLSSRPTRSIAPNHGVFFADSLVLRSGAKIWNNRGYDYQIVELHQEATLLFGRELCSVVLVLNQEIPSDVTIDYQALGGHYAKNDKAISNLYQSVIQDNRQVDWNNVFNKPTEFNPSIHRHLLDDVYGFEPVVDYLERIKRAITLGQTGVVLSIIDSLLGTFKCKELPKVLPSTKMVGYDAMLYFLSRRKLLGNIWVETTECDWHKGSEGIIRVDTSGYPVGTTLYWEFYSPDGPVALFNARSHAFVTDGGIMELRIYVPAESYAANENLYIGIKENPLDEDYKAVTYRINIKEAFTSTSAYGYMVYANLGEENYDNLVASIAQDEERRLFYLVHHK
jgi:hypothetical protein